MLIRAMSCGTRLPFRSRSSSTAEPQISPGDDQSVEGPGVFEVSCFAFDLRSASSWNRAGALGIEGDVEMQHFLTSAEFFVQGDGRFVAIVGLDIDHPG